MKKYLIAGTALGLLFPFAAFASLNTDLQYGSTGQDVTALQEFLKQQNVYSGPISGNFYSLTLTAVKKFQSAEGITPVSGYVGPVTRGEINQILAGQVSTSEGSATATQPPVDLSQQASTTTQGNSSSLIQSLLAQLAALNDRINSLQQTQQQVASSTQAIVQNTQQVAQNTQKIVQNTTPTAVSTPTPPPVVNGISLTVNNVQVPFSQGFDEIDVTAVYTENGIPTGSGSAVNSSPNIPTFSFSTSDGQSGTGTKVCEGNPINWCGEDWSFVPKALGTTKITASANGISKSIDVVAVPYVPVDPIATGNDLNPVIPVGYTSQMAIGTITLSPADERIEVNTIYATTDSATTTKINYYLGGTTAYSAATPSEDGSETANSSVASGAFLSSDSPTTLTVNIGDPMQTGNYTLTITSIGNNGVEDGKNRTIQGLPITFHYTVQ